MAKIVNLHHAVGSGAPVTIVDGPADGCFVFAAQVPDDVAENWRQAVAVFEGVQREMLDVWSKCKQAEDARIVAEDRVAAEKRRIELAAEQAEQEKLDREIGPREWVKVTRQRPQSHHDVLVHRASCAAVARAANHFVASERLRLPDAVAFLIEDAKREKSSFDDGARPCGQCGRELREAWELAVPTSTVPNPAGAPGHPWF